MICQIKTNLYAYFTNKYLSSGILSSYLNTKINFGFIDSFTCHYEIMLMNLKDVWINKYIFNFRSHYKIFRWIFIALNVVTFQT